MCVWKVCEFSLRYSILCKFMKLSLLIVSFKYFISWLVFWMVSGGGLWKLPLCLWTCLGSAVFEHLLAENRNREERAQHPRPKTTLCTALQCLPSALKWVREGEEALWSLLHFCPLRTSCSFSQTNCPGKEKKGFLVMCRGGHPKWGPIWLGAYCYQLYHWSAHMWVFLLI